MLNRFLILFLLMFSFNLIAQDEAAGDTENVIEVDVPMNLGKSIKLNFVPFDQFKIVNESIVKAQIVKTKSSITLELEGLKPGQSAVILRDSAGEVKVKYAVNVTASDQTKQVGQLKELLKDVEGLEIGIKGDKVYVGGNIIVPSDIGKVVVVLEGFPDVLVLVELSPQTQQVIARKMQEEIQRNGMKDVTVRVVNGAYWVEGIVNSQEEFKKVDQIILAYMPDSILSLAKRKDAVQSFKKSLYENLVSISSKPKPEPLPKMFKIVAQFVELTKSYDKIFGFGWTPIIGDGAGKIQIGKTTNGGVTSQSNGTLSATISNLFPKLNSAKSAGHARVIQSGVIVTKENNPGTLNKSTQINYVIGSGETARTATAEAKFDLNVKPNMLQEERINLDVGITISAVTGDNSSVTLQNSIKTQIVVKSQESAVLGGVVSSKTTTDFDKDPPFPQEIEGATPLFSFLKSKKYSTNRSQFVVFITPEIIESASTGVQDIEKKFRKRSR